MAALDSAQSKAKPGPRAIRRCRRAAAFCSWALPCCRSPPPERRAYLLSLFMRIMIFAIAAIGLDLILGYGALISFGHAAFIGLGAYAVGILAAHDIHERSIALAAALAAVDAVRLPHRPRLPAHQGRLLHHDHAGVRADGVLHRELARALWRRRRPDHPHARHVFRLSAARERAGLLLPRPRLLSSRATSCAGR